jgi:NADPH:quinone reductase-like Zn-dependent oxidoreductase
MKALIRLKYGTPEQLQIAEREIPAVSEGEVRIKVHAATVNRTDLGHLSGKPYIVRLFWGFSKPKSPVTGTDFAGVIVDVGKGVSGFKVGDRVWGFHDDGAASHAEYATFSVSNGIALIPASLPFDEAVACAEGAHYGYNFLNKISLKPGDKVLLNGATGAIGSAMLQMLNEMGMDITAVCATPHIERIKALGASRVFDYLKEDFTAHDGKYQAVLDAVGKSTFFKCKHLLGPGGIYISSELGPYWQNPFLALITPLFRGKKVVFPIPSNVPRSLQTITALVEKGAFKPLIDRRYKLEQASEAFTYVATGEKIGNVILQIQP